MSSCQPARSRSNNNQCRPARSRSNNPCQARPNTPRQPRNGQAQTVGGYEEEEEEEYSTFRIGCALGVLFVILLGSYNMYFSSTKNVNDNYPYMKPRPPIGRPPFDPPANSQFPYERPPIDRLHSDPPFPGDRPPMNQFPNRRPPVGRPPFDIPPFGSDGSETPAGAYEKPPAFERPPVGRPFPDDRPQMDEYDFPYERPPPINQPPVYSEPDFDFPEVKPFEKFPALKNPTKSFEKPPKKEVPNKDFEFPPEWFEEDDPNDKERKPSDTDYDTDYDTSFDPTFDEYDEGYKGSNYKFNGDEDLKFNDDEGEYFLPTDFGPLNPFDSSNDDKFWDNENDFSKGVPKFDDEPYTIDAYDSYDGSPKKVDDGKYDPNWDRPNFVGQDKFGKGTGRFSRGQNRRPIERRPIEL